MSKQAKTRLTGLRKDRCRLPVDVVDELNERLRKIKLLADLLGVCRAEFLPPETLENTGLFIADEVRGIKAVLHVTDDLGHE